MRRILPTVQILARLALGAGIMPYAVSKLMQAQLQVSPFEYTRPRPVPDAAGSCRVHSGRDALLRPVQTLGALLMFPVLLNVVLFNDAMNLWPDTKVISAVLLGIDVLLLTEAPKLPRILKVLRETLRFSLSANEVPCRPRSQSPLLSECGSVGSRDLRV